MRTTLTAVTGALLLGTALAAPAQAEVIIRLAPVHSDAMIENYNPYNLSGPHAYVQDFAYEPLWIDNVWHPDKDFPALATSYEIAPDLTSVTYHLAQGVKWSDGVPFTANDPYDQRVLYPDHPPNLVHEIYPPYFSLLDRRAANRERAADASRRRRSRRRR